MAWVGLHLGRRSRRLGHYPIPGQIYIMGCSLTCHPRLLFQKFPSGVVSEKVRHWINVLLRQELPLIWLHVLQVAANNV
jgi:hypothetical protein